MDIHHFFKPTNNRLTFSTVFSLLLHLLVLFSISLFLKINKPVSQIKKIEILEVRFSQPVHSLVTAKYSSQILTAIKPAPFEIEQAKSKKTQPPETVVKISDQSTPLTDPVEGVAFPGAVATPFKGQTRTINPFSLISRTDQHSSQRTYHQQAQETEARLRTEFQAQVMTQHLQQMLTKILDVQPLVSGKCQIAAATDGQNFRLKCDSSALYETISNDQKNVVDLLTALRGMGRNFNGFSAGEEAGKPRATLINAK